MSLIPTLVSAVFTYLKADPKKAAHYIVVAIGYATVADSILQKAIEVLKQVLVGLGAS